MKRPPARNLISYFKNIGRFRLLSRKEEYELGRRAFKGDREAQEKLVVHNLRFVVRMAGKYGNHLPLEDRIALGNIGLMEAAKRFDPARGFKFISYARHWIEQSILSGLTSGAHAVKLPTNKMNAMLQIGKIREKLMTGLEREPTVQEIASSLDLSEYDVDRLSELRVVSLEDTIGKFEHDGDRSRMIDTLSSDESPPPDNKLMQESFKLELESILDTLRPREKLIIKLYFGIDQERHYILEEIGDKLGLTRERVRQIVHEVLTKLRKSEKVEEMRCYL